MKGVRGATLRLWFNSMSANCTSRYVQGRLSWVCSGACLNCVLRVCSRLGKGEVRPWAGLVNLTIYLQPHWNSLGLYSLSQLRTGEQASSRPPSNPVSPPEASPKLPTAHLKKALLTTSRARPSTGKENRCSVSRIWDVGFFVSKNEWKKQNLGKAGDQAMLP